MTRTSKPVRVAAVQATPVFLDLDATVDKACGLVAEAAGNGAGIVVFPEVFVPTYPDWVWRTNPWADGEARWSARYFDNAVEVPSPATDTLGAAAAAADVYVAIGISELDRASSTLFNSLLYLGPDGSVMGVHRKLMPTGAERLVWGQGDGSGLHVFETPYGRLGGLTCWESYMPLARAAMYEQGIEIYLAPTWDNSDVWVPTLQHIAKEGRTWVVGVTPYLTGAHVPADIPGRDDVYGGDDDAMSRGNTSIVDPHGRVVAGPLTGEEGIVYAEVDTAECHRSRAQFDPVGHYARPDVFQLRVDRRALRPDAFPATEPTDPNGTSARDEAVGTTS